MDTTKFNIEYQYSLYLEKMNLKEEQMHPVQKQETKRAFISGIDDVADMQLEQGVTALDDMFNQVNDFFKKQSQKAN
ncbi:hypothetical protein [Marinilabilia salmonicolor]|uniref:hypothetical protein n=1 Tax=Marinilabilia salmonicolor TaxID=989 RepID=UPI00029B22CC|nr:hypothetical protein [Marinilabilia salmonicolor]